MLKRQILDSFMLRNVPLFLVTMLKISKLEKHNLYKDNYSGPHVQFGAPDDMVSYETFNDIFHSSLSART